MSKRKWQEGEDYLELSPEELIKKNIFIPQEPPDTEDGKYVLFSVKGTLKIASGSIEYLDNDLWDCFAECINWKRESEEKTIVVITYQADFIEVLLKLKLHKEFEKFIPIIDDALNNLEKVIHIRQKFDNFISLCKLYGKLYGVYNTPEDKGKEKLRLNFLFTMLNPSKFQNKKEV